MTQLACAIGSMLLLIGNARADEWTRADTGWELALVGLAVVDYGQTRYFLRRNYEVAPGSGIYRPNEEVNPLLGSRPDRTRLLIFGTSALASHAIVARLLPSRVRRPWQAVAILGMTINVSRTVRVVGWGWEF